MRFMMFIISKIILSPHTSNFYSVTTCSTLYDLYTTHSYPLELISQNYPACKNTLLGIETNEIYILVQIGRYPPERLAATVNMSFGTAGWLGMVLNMIGVELWLNWSANEGKRIAQKVKKWWSWVYVFHWSSWVPRTLTNYLVYIIYQTERVSTQV